MVWILSLFGGNGINFFIQRALNDDQARVCCQWERLCMHSLSNVRPQYLPIPCCSRRNTMLIQRNFAAVGAMAWSK
jgi:hypothetical protein